MIWNVLIMKHGLLLVDANFGECHSLRFNEELLANFVSTINIGMRENTGSSLKNITFKEYLLHFYKEHNESGILFVIISDLEKDTRDIHMKMDKNASLFHKRHMELLEQFQGDTRHFDAFKTLLIEMIIVQKKLWGTP